MAVTRGERVVDVAQSQAIWRDHTPRARTHTQRGRRVRRRLPPLVATTTTTTTTTYALFAGVAPSSPIDRRTSWVPRREDEGPGGAGESGRRAHVVVVSYPRVDTRHTSMAVTRGERVDDVLRIGVSTDGRKPLPTRVTALQLDLM